MNRKLKLDVPLITTADRYAAEDRRWARKSGADYDDAKYDAYRNYSAQYRAVERAHSLAQHSPLRADGTRMCTVCKRVLRADETGKMGEPFLLIDALEAGVAVDVAALARSGRGTWCVCCRRCMHRQFKGVAVVRAKNKTKRRLAELHRINDIEEKSVEEMQLFKPHKRLYRPVSLLKRIRIEEQNARRITESAIQESGESILVRGVELLRCAEPAERGVLIEAAREKEEIIADAARRFLRAESDALRAEALQILAQHAELLRSPPVVTTATGKRPYTRRGKYEKSGKYSRKNTAPRGVMGDPALIRDVRVSEPKPPSHLI